MTPMRPPSVVARLCKTVRTQLLAFPPSQELPAFPLGIGQAGPGPAEVAGRGRAVAARSRRDLVRAPGAMTAKAAGTPATTTTPRQACRIRIVRRQLIPSGIVNWQSTTTVTLQAGAARYGSTTPGQHDRELDGHQLPPSAEHRGELVVEVSRPPGAPGRPGFAGAERRELGRAKTS